MLRKDVEETRTPEKEVAEFTQVCKRFALLGGNCKLQQTILMKPTNLEKEVSDLCSKYCQNRG
ncbi:hypothetical protein YC2023_089796 [Brassica napus]